MYFSRVLSQRNTKVVILRIRIWINPLNLHRVRIHWIPNPFLDFAKETKNPFLNSESGLGFFPKKCTLLGFASRTARDLFRRRGRPREWVILMYRPIASVYF